MYVYFWLCGFMLSDQRSRRGTTQPTEFPKCGLLSVTVSSMMHEDDFVFFHRCQKINKLLWKYDWGAHYVSLELPVDCEESICSAQGIRIHKESLTYPALWNVQLDWSNTSRMAHHAYAHRGSQRLKAPVAFKNFTYSLGKLLAVVLRTRRSWIWDHKSNILKMHSGQGANGVVIIGTSFQCLPRNEEHWGELVWNVDLRSPP